MATDHQELDFMSKELLTTDIDTQRHLEEMFILQKQAGEEVAESGSLLQKMQRRYNMIP